MRPRRYGGVLAALLLALTAPNPGIGETARPESGRVVATYDAGLAGMSLGEFKVIATFEGTAYEMAAHGRFSLLAGLLYKASGKTASSGTLTDESPKPVRFSFSYEGGKKREQRQMSFVRGSVSDIRIVPQKKRTNPNTIPVTAEQLKDVLDPLTAAFLSVQSDAPPGNLEVCRVTIPVFDGKQRFDLLLSPKGSARLGSSAPKGLPGRVSVCRVRYEPIGGHRTDHPGVKFMRKTDGIEAWLVPVPRTGLYIPYKILVPTAWGSGTITLTGVKAKFGQHQRAEVP